MTSVFTTHNLVIPIEYDGIEHVPDICCQLNGTIFKQFQTCDTILNGIIFYHSQTSELPMNYELSGLGEARAISDILQKIFYIKDIGFGQTPIFCLF
jgi:hypothetical protein